MRGGRRLRRRCSGIHRPPPDSSWSCGGWRVDQHLVLCGEVFPIVEVEKVMDVGSVHIGWQGQCLGVGRFPLGPGHASHSHSREPVIAALPCESVPARAV
ncbi:hypothetical protein FRACA_1490010 [Frankia canadensis]|uniref:Uncharacterized protein n=1 Tax=Frankia canadensis TaxID=1836972 RepID=A0A2I2KLS6_9ACTN|nr:hypothetical protein FRACA_1490010 [Frankia canadensis]SOU53908.1 hypothetical protein FRACA_1490010 [Frankia canadensis]